MPTPVLLLRPAPAPAAPVLVKSHPALFRGPESREQAEAGNYPKRRLAWRGLTIAVENEAGSLRDWGGGQTRMLFPYGEVMNTEGSDGDPVDCYLGPRLEDAPFVYVVHQNRAGRWDQYDEDKAMLGFLSAEEAAQAYLAHYDDPRFLGPITTMAVDEFVAKVRATRDNPGMIKSWLGGADLLKATIKKTVTVPGYYRKDGTWVPPHTKAVHYNPNHDLEAIAGGGVSHSQKQAHAKLSKEEWFHKLDTFDKATHVMAHATDIQDAASAAAAVSGWKAAALAGKNPTAAQWSAFHSLPKEKQGALYDAVLDAGKSFAHLKPLTGHVPGTPAPGTPAWHAAKNAAPPAEPADPLAAYGKYEPVPEAIAHKVLADAGVTLHPKGVLLEWTAKVPGGTKHGNIPAKGPVGKDHLLMILEQAKGSVPNLNAMNAAFTGGGQKPQPPNKTAEAFGVTPQPIPNPFSAIEQLIADAPKVEVDSGAAKDQLEQLAKTGSHYQKEALKKCKAIDGWSAMTPAVQLTTVMALYKKLQGAASASAAVSLWKKQLLAGKHPSAAQASAFADLMASNPEKSKKLQDEVIGAIGQQKYIELVGSIPHNFDPKKQAAAPASSGEKKSGPAGIPAYDYLAQNKHATPGVKLGTDWLQANPGKLSELHAAMQDHGYAGDVIKQAIKNTSTFIPAAGPSPMDKQTIDSMVAKEDVEALQSMVNHAKHPEAAAYAKEQLEKLQAAAGPKDGDTKQGADGTLVFKDGRWHKQAAKDAAWPGPALPDGWSFTPNDPGFSGAHTLSTDMPDGSVFYVAVSDDGHGWEAGYINAEGDPQDHFGSGNEDDVAEWINGNIPEELHLSFKHVQALMMASKKKVATTIAPAAATSAKKSATDYAAPAAASFGISPDGDSVKNAAIHAAAGNIAGIESILASIHPTKVKTKGAVQHILDAAKKEHGVAAPAPAPAPAADSSFMAMSLPDSWSYQAATNSFSGPAGNPKYKFSVYPTATGIGFKVNVVSSSGTVIGEHFFKDAQIAADFMQASNPFSPGPGVLEKLHSPVAKAGATHPAAAAAKPPRVASVKPAAAPSTIGVEAQVFHNTEPGHSKQWAVSVSGSQLITSYGKIGAKQQTTVKDMGSIGSAILQKNKLIDEKKAKGYVYKPGAGVLHQHTAPANATQAVAAAVGAALEPPKKPDLPGGTTFAVAATAIQKAIAEGNADKLENELQLAYGFTSEAAQKMQQYAIAGLKYLNQPKPDFVAQVDWDGPKDGDTKPGASGMLVFKDGYWHKVPTSLSNAEAQAIIQQHGFSNAGANPNLQQAVTMAMNGNVEALKELKGQVQPGHIKTHGVINSLLAALGHAPAKAASGKVNKLTKAALNKIVSEAKGGAKLSATGKVLIEKAKAAAYEGDVAGVQAVIDDVSGSKLGGTKAVLAAIYHALTGDVAATTGAAGNVTMTPSKSAASPAPAAAPAAAPKAAAPAPTPGGSKAKMPVTKPGEPQDMSGWVNVGPQKGSNPGGSFKDKAGQVWYCKFPASESIARNEVLASKFYQMLGFDVPNLKLVKKDGKVGVASKWQDGLKKGSASDLAAAKGMHDGFVVDAWLANWDVVGPDYTNTQLKDGKAYRVDVGGSLLYRAQGGAKGGAFGEDVPELESLLDGSKNASGKAVFSGASKASMLAGAKQLNKLKPSQIRELVDKLGPGTDAEKTALVHKLVARRKFILDKFGLKDQWEKKSVDETQVPVDPSVLPKPLDFSNWQGTGKGLSSKEHVNQQNTKDSQALVSFAAKGNLKALKDYHYDAVNKETGALLGKKPITEHPSNQIQQQWASLVQTLQSIAYPPVEALQMPSLGIAGTLGEIAEAAGSFAPEQNVTTVSAEHRFGYFMALTSVDGDVVTEMAKELEAKESYVPQDHGHALIKKGQANYHANSALVKKYISGVQASGSINHVWSQGKTTAAGVGIQKLTKAIYDEAMEIPEGMVLTRWMDDDTANDVMTEQFKKAGKGAVLQNTDSMCASMWKHWQNTPHFCSEPKKAIMMRMRAAKGAKVTPSYGSGSHWGEGEMTTLPGQRYLITNVSPGGDVHPHGIIIDCILLPPDEGFVSQLSQGAAMGKSLKGIESWTPILLLRRTESPRAPSPTRPPRVISATRIS